MSETRHVVLKLYRELLKEGKNFSSYGYRTYAIRRIRDSFREHKDVDSAEQLELLIKEGEQNLDIIKRQALIDKLYKAAPLVVEGPSCRQLTKPTS